MADVDGIIDEDAVLFLRKYPVAGEFTPYFRHSKEADAIDVYFKNDADYSKRLNENITLFLSIDTDEVIGCRIKGIQGALDAK